MRGHGLNDCGPVWWVPWEEMAAEDCQVKSQLDKAPIIEYLQSNVVLMKNYSDRKSVV